MSARQMNVNRSKKATESQAAQGGMIIQLVKSQIFKKGYVFDSGVRGDQEALVSWLSSVK